MIKKALKYSFEHEKKLVYLLKKITKNNLKNEVTTDEIYKKIAKVLLDFTVKKQNIYKKFDLKRDGDEHVKIVTEQLEEVKKWQIKQLEWINSKEHNELRKRTLRQAELKARDVKGNQYAQFLKKIVSKDADYFIWETVGDDRVRDEHQDRDQEVFSFKNADLLPGEDPRCRCWATIILKNEIN